MRSRPIKRHWCLFCGINVDDAPGGLFSEGLYGPIMATRDAPPPGICGACVSRARDWFSRPPTVSTVVPFREKAVPGSKEVHAYSDGSK